ncbi:MAG TPA: DMT family transporter, partial [Anaerolineae bacterium]|nr:DMT family transporter [Anaerolineae bacterium]
MHAPLSTEAHVARGYTAALVAAAILSLTGILIRCLTHVYHVPPLILAFWRDTLVAVALLPLLALLAPGRLRVGRAHLPYLAAYGLVLAAFNVLWTLAVALTGAAVATVLVYSSAGLTVLLGRWLFGERLDAARLLAVALSLGGCALVSGAWSRAVWDTNLLGIATGALSGLGYAFYTLMGRSAARRGLDPWATLLYTFGFAAVCLLGLNLAPIEIVPGTAAGVRDLVALGGIAAGSTLPAWGLLALLAAGPTLVGFGLYNVSLAHLPSAVANLIVTLEPAFTTAIAYVLLGERLDALQVGGSIVILLAVVVLRVGEGVQTRRRVAS